jgi:SAM-dependent methyltransferase
MTAVFGSEYADAYDHLYSDKDYNQECELIDRLLRTYGDKSVQSLLDLGCGTGNHALPLARRGYSVLGVDRSNDMLDAARNKAASESMNGTVTYHQGDIRDFPLEQVFDAALMMFAVLGYQLENRDVLAALRSARQHLRSGGILIFDVWYGPAVLKQGPTDRIKTITTDKERILRLASAQLDVQRHLCEVSYHLWRLEGNRLVGEAEEKHLMRFFFPLELNLFLECSGFAPVRLGSFPDFDRDPDETTWNVLCVARAV